MERELYSLLVLLDVADIMTTHCARSHVTDERKKLILFRIKEWEKYESLEESIIFKKKYLIKCHTNTLTSWSITDTWSWRRFPTGFTSSLRASTLRHIHGLQIIQMREDPVHSTL